MLKRVAAKIKSALTPRPKPAVGRAMFAFRCDRRLQDKVRFLSHIVKSPIFVLCEHLFQIALAHIAMEIEGRGDHDAVIAELRQHLKEHQRAPERVSEERYGRSIVTGALKLTTEEEALVGSLVELLAEIKDRENLDDELGLEALRLEVEVMIARLRTKRDRDAQHHEKQMRALQEVNRRFPNLVQDILSTVKECDEEELAALGLDDLDDQRSGREDGLPG